MAVYKATDKAYYQQMPSWFVDALPAGDDEDKSAAFFLSDGDREAWDQPVVVVLEMPPNFVLLRHAHPSHRVEVVVKGQLTTEDGTVLGPGDVMVASPGEIYGPKVIGPEGCTTAEVFSRADAMVRIIADSADGFREHDLRENDFPRDLVIPRRDGESG
jgi:hypothetical protein